MSNGCGSKYRAIELGVRRVYPLVPLTKVYQGVIWVHVFEPQPNVKMVWFNVGSWI